MSGWSSAPWQDSRPGLTIGRAPFSPQAMFPCIWKPTSHTSASPRRSATRSSTGERTAPEPHRRRTSVLAGQPGAAFRVVPRSKRLSTFQVKPRRCSGVASREVQPRDASHIPNHMRAPPRSLSTPGRQMAGPSRKPTPDCGRVAHLSPEAAELVAPGATTGAEVGRRCDRGLLRPVVAGTESDELDASGAAGLGVVAAHKGCLGDLPLSGIREALRPPKDGVPLEPIAVPILMGRQAWTGPPQHEGPLPPPALR